MYAIRNPFEPPAAKGKFSWLYYLSIELKSKFHLLKKSNNFFKRDSLKIIFLFKLIWISIYLIWRCKHFENLRSLNKYISKLFRKLILNRKIWIFEVNPDVFWLFPKSFLNNLSAELASYSKCQLRRIKKYLDHENFKSPDPVYNVYILFNTFYTRR